MDLIKSQPDLFDRIEAYYLNNAKLSEKEQQIAERMELGFSLLLHHRNKKAAISKLIAVQAQKGENLSVAQAYKDLSAAERIFIPIQTYSKELLRLTLIESSMRDIKEAEKRAKEAISVSDWNKCMQIKNKAEYRIIQVSGITDFNADLPDFSKINPQDIKIDVPADMFNLMKKITQKGTIDVTEFMAFNSKDAEIIDDESEV